MEIKMIADLLPELDRAVVVAAFPLGDLIIIVTQDAKVYSLRFDMLG